MANSCKWWFIDYSSIGTAVEMSAYLNAFRQCYCVFIWSLESTWLKIGICEILQWESRPANMNWEDGETLGCIWGEKSFTSDLVERQQESWVSISSIYHLQCWGSAIHSGRKRTVNMKAIWILSFLHQVNEKDRKLRVQSYFYLSENTKREHRKINMYIL